MKFLREENGNKNEMIKVLVENINCLEKKTILTFEIPLIRLPKNHLYIEKLKHWLSRQFFHWYKQKSLNQIKKSIKQTK